MASAPRRVQFAPPNRHVVGQIQSKGSTTQRPLRSARRHSLAYQMIAERDNEKAQSRSVSLFIAAAKARVWASEGWQVVVTDDTGKTFSPAELEDLCAPDARKSRAGLVGGDGLAGASGNATAGKAR